MLEPRLEAVSVRCDEDCIHCIDGSSPLDLNIADRSDVELMPLLELARATAAGTQSWSAKKASSRSRIAVNFGRLLGFESQHSQINVRNVSFLTNFESGRRPS